jgi:hypothetical protein
MNSNAHQKHLDVEYDDIGEEDEDVFEEEPEEDDDDGDALSSSPSIPDDVNTHYKFIIYEIAN